jgi:hypothetical protein
LNLRKNHSASAPLSRGNSTSSGRDDEKKSYSGNISLSLNKKNDDDARNVLSITDATFTIKNITLRLIRFLEAFLPDHRIQPTL